MCDGGSVNASHYRATVFADVLGSQWRACGIGLRHATDTMTSSAEGIPRVLFLVAAAAGLLSAALSWWLMFGRDAMMLLCCRWPACMRRRSQWSQAMQVRTAIVCVRVCMRASVCLQSVCV